MILYRSDLRTNDSSTGMGTPLVVTGTLTRTPQRSAVQILVKGPLSTIRLAVLAYSGSQLVANEERLVSLTACSDNGKLLSQSETVDALVGTEIQVRVLSGVPTGLAVSEGYDIYGEVV